MTGRFSPGFERYGGAAPGIRELLDGLNAARGTAYDTSVDGVVYAENEAIARCLWIGWEQNQRLANQFDPRRMTDMLPRWERILGLTPSPSDTLVHRRAAVAARWANVGVVPTRQELTDRLAAALGDVFVSYEVTPLADAVQWWPGGATNPLTPWSSTTARIGVRVQRPAGMPLGEFWDRVGRMHAPLDELLPTWVTWNWFVTSPSGEGFFLDDEHNLDHERFD